MKNKTLKFLSVLLSFCMLATSPVSATEFSDGTDFTEDSMPAQTDTTAAAADSADNFSADDATDDTAAFDSEDEIFTDEEMNSEFSSDEAESNTEEAPVAGGLENSISTYFNYSIVEADIESDPSLATSCATYKGSNLESQDYEAWATTVDSYLTTSPDGSLMRVQAGALDGKLLIEYYDTSYNFKRAMTLDLSLPIFGAFYESNDNYYVLTGQNNPDHNDSVETYRVTKYSKDWIAQGSCSLFGANTAQPFAFGTARMMVSGNYLYVRTCHVMYNGHQANVTFSVNTSNMSIMNQYYQVEITPSGYVSHSFSQFLKMDNGTFLGVDQGDAYPRGINLVKSTIDSTTGRFTKDYSNSLIMNFTLGSGTYTAVTVGGFEYSDSSYLVAGSCDIDNSKTTRNVFILSAPKSGDTPVIRYLSNYAGTEDTASAPHLIKTGSNSFIILWSSQGHVYYTALDGNGQQTSSIYQMVGNLSDCVPVIVNGKLIWYTWKNEANTFYNINLSNLSENHAVRIINGHKFTNEKPVNGLMKRTCTICGYQDTASVPVSIDLDQKTSDGYEKTGSSCYIGTGEASSFWWIPRYNSANSSYTRAAEYEFECSDNSILSLQRNSNDRATVTGLKSGKATLTVRSKYDPDCSASTDVYVDMLTDDLTSFSLSEKSYTYDGTEHKPTVTLKLNRIPLTEGTDFKVSYDGDLVNAGDVTVTATGIGKYTGSVSKTFRIRPIYLTEDNTQISIAPAYYNGAEQKPEVTLVYNGKKLNLNTDYVVTYSDNIRVSKYASVRINTRGNYGGVLYQDFEIQKGDISKCSITLSADSFQYDGTEKEPDVTVKSGDVLLTENTDYVISYRNNQNPGTASVTVRGIRYCTGSITQNFKITQADLSGFTVSLSSDTFSYDGSEKKPSVTVKSNGEKLTSGTDFTVTYSNNINAGTATAVITGKGGYSGTITKEFTITPADISQLTASLSANLFRYNGAEQKPSVTVKSGAKTLVPDTDFTISYSNNINVGTATVTITGQGNYTGSMTRTFTITNARIPAVITAKNVTLNQSTKKTSVFTAETDGKITLKSSNSKIVKVSGTKIIPVAPGKVTLTITAARGQNYEKASKKISITVRPLTTSKLSLKSTTKKQATVSWTAAKSISGYQIYYSQRSDMKNAKYITAKSSAKSTVLKNLTSKKKYYVRIRTYKTIRGKRYYSTWSSVKSVTVK